MGRPTKTVAPGPETEEEEGRRLNEEARLYPWQKFNQRELRLMTHIPRRAIASAFNAPEFHCPLGVSRPEKIDAWWEALDHKMKETEFRE